MIASPLFSGRTPLSSKLVLVIPLILFVFPGAVSIGQENASGPSTEEESVKEPVRDQTEKSGSSTAEAKSTETLPDGNVEREKWNTGWSVYLDNDLVIGQDQEYTGGIAINLSGRRAKEWFFSLDPILGFINDVTGVSDLGSDHRSFTRHSFEFGVTAFTPDNISTDRPLPDQHPYAGLVFVNNVRQRTLPSEGTTYKSVFSLGVLGTSIPEEAQKITHDVTGSEDPEGWENQISDGGEPTARYTLLRQDLLYTVRQGEFGDLDLKSSFGGSVGYVTQLQGGFNVRWGRLTTPSWSYSPDFAEYVNMGSPVHRETQADPFPHEIYVWAGIHARLRGYNALLEGQFRDSEVTFDRNELNSILGEASLGVACGFQTGTRVSVGIRGRTPEIDEGEENRPVWGTLMISQAY